MLLASSPLLLLLLLFLLATGTLAALIIPHQAVLINSDIRHPYSLDPDSIKNSNTNHGSDSDFPTSIGYLGSIATGAPPFLAQTNPIPQVIAIPPSAPDSIKGQNYQLPQPIETGGQSFDHDPLLDDPIQRYFGTIAPYSIANGHSATKTNKSKNKAKDHVEDWGVYEFALPPQCHIKQVHLLSRHGSRYPISLQRSLTLTKLKRAKDQKLLANATGALQFLRDWEYSQGIGMLTKLGQLQLFEKGVNLFFRYGGLFNFEDFDNGYDDGGKGKIVARTTTQSRMTQSAMYFLSGFFGLDWQKYVNLELQIEHRGFNTTLAPSNSCPRLWRNANEKICNIGNNSNKLATNLEKEEDDIYNVDSISDDQFSTLLEISNFVESYLQDAVLRINKLLNLSASNSNLFQLTAHDLFRLQEVCTYELNNLGFSHFCRLFSQREWQMYGYVHDWNSYNRLLFPNDKISKALGIGWCEELRSRLTGTPFDSRRQASQNSTLNSGKFFPLNQTFYFDFSHDTTIANILHALGIGEQFRTNFTNEGPFSSPSKGSHRNNEKNEKVKDGDDELLKEEWNFQLAKIIPFAAQLVIEVIECDTAVPFDRSSTYINLNSTEDTNTTKYVHMLLNDHTISLSRNLPGFCSHRVDGWCELEKFVEHLELLWDVVGYDEVCYGDD